MTYPIEKGYPIPVLYSNYNWKRMEVGDSFFVPKAEKAVSRVRAAASWANKQYPPKRWIVRVVEEKGVPGVRVWRQD